MTQSPFSVDLNIDLGELPNEPEVLFRLAHRVNVACGGHAGDAHTMRQACLAAKAAGALVGAHPSFEDRAGFGRRPLPVPPHELKDSVARQCRALLEAARSCGIAVSHVKPHGALYHEANRLPEIASALVEGVLASLGVVPIVGPSRGELRLAAERASLPYLREGFADRGTLPDGSLVPRGAPGALIYEPEAAASQARRLAHSGGFDTLCVHSDTPNAVNIATRVREALAALEVRQDRRPAPVETLRGDDVFVPMPMGDAAWRIALPAQSNPAAVLNLLRSWPGVVDVVVADGWALVRFPSGAPPANPRDSLASLTQEPDTAPATHVIPVRYDGPDLDDVARQLELTTAEVIARHVAREYTVQLVGFLPSFAYLGPLDGELSRIGRRGAPRPRVPAGAVAVARGRTAVYPFASPGGWQLLGTAIDFQPFEPTRGARLKLGDRVRFEAAK